MDTILHDAPPAPPPQTPPPRRSSLYRLTYTLDTFMRRVFFRLGYLVSAFPLRTILLALLFMGLSLIGLVRFRTESRGNKLWVPQGTVALANQRYVEDVYELPPRGSSIAFRGLQTDGLANQRALLRMIDVAEEGFDIVAPLPDSETGTISFPQRCETTTDSQGNVVCATFSVFNLFYDVDFIQRDPSGDVDFFATVRNRIGNLSDTQIKNTLYNALQDPSTTSFDGVPLIATELIGSPSGSGDTFDARVLMYFQVIDNLAVEDNGELVDDAADALEEQWTTLLLDNSRFADTDFLEWFVQSQYSEEDAFEDALSGDLPLFAAGFALLTTYIIFFLGDFHAVRSHMWLAIAAILTNALALATCFGISSATGMFYGPVHQILPLLIVGIGIDDCFHVTRAADDLNLVEGSQKKSVRVRVALALSNAGASITVTSFTNIAVFLLSSISKLPALRFFSLWAAIGIFFAWAFTITFFTAFVAIDMGRIDGKRRDCCPCFPPVMELKEFNWFKKPAGGFSRFFRNQFGPFILHPIVRVVLLIGLLGWLAAAAYGTSQLYLKFEFSFFFPDGTAQREYQDVVDENFSFGDPVRIYIRDRDLSLPENQQRLFQLCRPNGVIANNEWIQGDAIDCWYLDFKERNNAPGEEEIVDQDAFVDSVKAFIAEGAPGFRYEQDIVFNEDRSKVMGCRFSTQYEHRETNDDEVDSLESVRAAADSVGFGDDQEGNPAAFSYSFFDIFSEQYAALPNEIGLSLGLAVVAVAIVCFVLVGHPLVAIICVLVVGVIIIDVLGLTNFSGVNLNSVSVITLALSAGISVDFVVHIARSFLEQVGTRRERAVKALGYVGPPVFYAGFSTLLSIIVLAGARSYIFKVIFRGFLFLIMMGFLHGFVFCPIVLSFIGPGSFYIDEEEKRMAEVALEERLTGKVHEGKELAYDTSGEETGV